MKLLVILTFLITISFGETFEEYKNSVAKDIIEFTKKYGPLISRESADGFLNTNKIILTKVIMSKNYQHLDAHTLLYLEYKNNLKQMITKHIFLQQLQKFQNTKKE